MRAWAIVGVVMVAGCLDDNPVFVPPPMATDVGSEGDPSEGEATAPPTGAGPGATTEIDDVTGSATTSDDTEDLTGPLAKCGNGIPEAGEDCDDGNQSEFDGCTNDCKVVACGDGVVGPGEACDDGDGDNSDECIIGCYVAACGDGYIQFGVEECDDGNAADDDECVKDCKLAACGDGLLNVGVEPCDDGNDVADDGCEPDCTPTKNLIVFVTKAVYQGNLGGLAGADIKCKDAAGAAGMPGEYRAWLSDNTMSAGSRIVHEDGWRYVTRNKTLVADDWDGLVSGTLKAPIDRDEFGDPAPPAVSTCGAQSVYTNTNPDGSTYNAMYDCMNWSSNLGPSAFGSYGQSGTKWTAGCASMQIDTCGSWAPLYCVQEP